MALPENIYVPIGVVAAAVIAGGIAYSGFISTKESKVSEFRQAWINELREEIATYVSRVDALIKHIAKDNLGRMMSITHIMSKKLDHSELYSEMLKSRISIMLRINDKEEKKEDYERNALFLSLIESIYTNFESGKTAEVYKHIALLTDASRSLLKHEWNRARDGEKRFQLAKDRSQRGIRWTTTVLLALLIAAAYEAISGGLPPSPSGKSASAAPAGAVPEHVKPAGTSPQKLETPPAAPIPSSLPVPMSINHDNITMPPPSGRSSICYWPRSSVPRPPMKQRAPGYGPKGSSSE
jgi:hypothetical protein